MPLKWDEFIGSLAIPWTLFTKGELFKDFLL